MRSHFADQERERNHIKWYVLQLVIHFSCTHRDYQVADAVVYVLQPQLRYALALALVIRQERLHLIMWQPRPPRRDLLGRRNG